MIGLPRSLRGRTLLLTVVGIVACEFVTFAVLGAYRHSLLAGRAHDFIGAQIAMVRAALTHATPEEVARELETQREGGSNPRLGRSTPDLPAMPQDADHAPRSFGAPRGPPRNLRMRLVPALPATATTEPHGEIAPPHLVEALREAFGADALRFTATPEPAVWAQMTPDGWWLTMPFARYSSPPLPWSIVLATLAAVGVMAGLVALYSLHLSRPLRALADAAGRFEVGQRPDLPLTGPDEVRAVTVQFNAMAERLERDDAERRVMLAGLPHDLRAPLARARLRLALMDNGPDGAKAGFERDLAEVGRIADQFVAYLRGLDHDTSGFAEADLGEIVQARGAIWRETGQDIAVTRSDTVRQRIDAGALARAIDNLIGNAFAHGAPPVRIYGAASEADRKGPSSEYRIVVEDGGRGIAAERRAEALKPFARLDTARGASGHCGLGLAVAQAVARLHGGRIELADAAGGGLSAAIVLPVG